jgi:hypothetical protein
MDIAVTNSFILYTFFHKNTTHSQFFFELAFEWFKVAKNGGRNCLKRGDFPLDSRPTGMTPCHQSVVRNRRVRHFPKLLLRNT